MVRGYHVYKDIWIPVVREEFQCLREGRNQLDPFAVAVMRGGTVISRVPKKFCPFVPAFRVGVSPLPAV